MTDANPQGPKRKVLIVSLHFPPINAPDMQRTRLALPYLRGLGWEPVVLAVAPEMIEGGVREPLLEETYPRDIRIVRVRGLPPRATRWAGVGSLWLRCGRALRAAGERLLRAERFDLVFFSTTQFDAFSLGPRWKARFGVPYVLDYQDPWINDYYRLTQTIPPGGALKFAFSQWRARRLEPAALRQAGGVIAVSDSYGPGLARNHPWFDPARVVLLPFGASERDAAIARDHAPAMPIVPSGDGYFHHVYAGRCGPDMSTSLTILFQAFRRYLAARPLEAARIRFHFVGTDYAPYPFGREWAMPHAKAEGIEAYVTEHCYRVPYFDALHYLARAEALVAVGSNDPSYSASKIFPYVLARRPMLVVFNANSPVMAVAKAMGCGLCFAFDHSADIDALAEQVAAAWFVGGGMRTALEPDRATLLPYLAEGMTQRLCACFEAAVGGGRPA
jgi:hypothetical protein